MNQSMKWIIGLLLAIIVVALASLTWLIRTNNDQSTSAEAVPDTITSTKDLDSAQSVLDKSDIDQTTASIDQNQQDLDSF